MGAAKRRASTPRGPRSTERLLASQYIVHRSSGMAHRNRIPWLVARIDAISPRVGSILRRCQVIEQSRQIDCMIR